MAVRFLPLGGCVGARGVVLGVTLGGLELAEEPSMIPGDAMGCLGMLTGVATTRRGAEFSTDQT